MRKSILEKRLQRLMAKKAKLTERCNASQDVNEVRSLTAELEELNEDIEDIREEISAIEAEEREQVPADAQLINSQVRGSFGTGAAAPENREEDPTASEEYRRAFMAYIQTGQVRGDVIDTGDSGAAIPITIMNEVINIVRKRYGNLYSKVRKMSVPGGVEIPVGALKASFKWITESTVSPRQEVGKLGKISFMYHTGEIRVAQTFLSQVLTLSAFESEVARVIAIAYLEAMDQAIVNGTGNGMPTGILNDPRVLATGNVVTFTAAQINNWTAWRKNFFSQLPLGYRAGEFIFPLSTVESYLETMADSNNNPIFRQATGLEVNDGDAVNPNGRFFGREISLVEPDILPDFDAASSNDVIGIFWQPYEYALNENFGFTMRRYFDEETNEWVDKALVVTDGKVLNPMGIWLLKKA